MAKKAKAKSKVNAANKRSIKYDDWMHSQLKNSKKDALGYLKAFMLSLKRVMKSQNLKLNDLTPTSASAV